MRLLSLATLALAACGSAATTTHTAKPAPASAQAQLAPQHLSWSSCSSGLQCATIKVPLDYANPQGQQISLALARLPAGDPSQRIGSLLTNPGGPGESGIKFLQEAATTFFSASLRARFDIVTWDPRGTGSSAAVNCLDGPQLDEYFHTDPNVNTPAKLNAELAQFHLFDNGCQQQSGYLLPHIGTADSARDIEAIRMALGEPKISYLGFSYGTFLGAEYAHLYPTHVRVFVLDGAVDPNQSYSAVALTQTAGFQQDYQDFLTHCINQGTTCPIYNGGNPGSLISGFLGRVEAGPVAVKGRSFGFSEAITGILAAMYSPDDWDSLANAIANANGGNVLGLLYFNDSYLERNNDGTYSNALEANIAINCVDYASPSNVQAYQQLATQLNAVSPLFGSISAWSPCIYWPVKANPPPGDLSAPGAPPILIISGTHDPATPLSWGENLHHEIPGSLFMIRNGDGHISYDQSSCVSSAVDTYLIQLKAPADGKTCS
jgi:pimeloyl-ACP methyl ester carboxylesterase